MTVPLRWVKHPGPSPPAIDALGSRPDCMAHIVFNDCSAPHVIIMRLTCAEAMLQDVPAWWYWAHMAITNHTPCYCWARTTGEKTSRTQNGTRGWVRGLMTGEDGQRHSPQSKLQKLRLTAEQQHTSLPCSRICGPSGNLQRSPLQAPKQASLNIAPQIYLSVLASQPGNGLTPFQRLLVFHNQRHKLIH